VGAGAESRYICAIMSLFRKHQRLLWLIFSSLALLGVFQVFWLQQVWKEQKEALRQEADYIFQKNVMSLQDSLVRRSMLNNNIQPDSMPLPFPPRGVPGIRHWQYRQESNMRVSMNSELKLRTPDTLSKVQVFITTGDSVSARPGEPGIHRVISRLMAPEAGSENRLVLKISRDTIVPDTLRAIYRRSLEEAGISLDFDFRRTLDFPVCFTRLFMSPSFPTSAATCCAR